MNQIEREYYEQKTLERRKAKIAEIASSFGYKNLAKFAVVRASGLNELIDRGIISSNIKTLPTNGGIYSENLRKAGVRLMLYCPNDNDSEYIYRKTLLLFTDKFLIVGYYDNYYKETYMENALAIPYSKIESLEITSKNHSGGYSSTVTKQGNAAARAAVGAVLAGTAGAIVGAASTPKPQTYTSYHSYDDETYLFNLKLKNKSSEEIITASLFEISNINLEIKDPDIVGIPINYTINMNLFDKSCYSYLSSRASVGNLCNQYIDVFNKLLHSAPDDQARQIIIDFIKKNSENKPSFPRHLKYHDNKTFLTTVYNKTKNESNDILKEIADCIGKVIEKENGIKTEISNLRAQYNSLSFFSFSEKKIIREQLKGLQEQEVKLADYPNLTPALLKIIRKAN